MSQGLRVSILGGGSAYTPGLVEGFIRQSRQVPVSQLVLMDIDEGKLKTVGTVVRKMLEAHLRVPTDSYHGREQAIRT